MSKSVWVAEGKAGAWAHLEQVLHWGATGEAADRVLRAGCEGLEREAPKGTLMVDWGGARRGHVVLVLGKDLDEESF